MIDDGPFGERRFGGCQFSKGTMDSMVVNGSFGGRQFSEGTTVPMAVNGQFAGLRFDGFGLVHWQGEDLAAHSEEHEDGGFDNRHVC